MCGRHVFKLLSKHSYMKNMDDLLRSKRDLGSRFVARMSAFFLPSLYVASSLNDFLEEKSTIVPTQKVWPFSVSAYYGCAVILVETPVSYSSLSSKIGTIAQGLCATDVLLSQPYGLSSPQRATLYEGKRLFQLLLVFRCEDGLTWLHSYRDKATPLPATQSELDTSVHARLALG